MSSKETHYNRKEQPANEEGGKEKGAGRKRQQLSPERAKDKAKKTRKEGGPTGEKRGDRPDRPKRDNTSGDRPFKRSDKPFERRDGGEGEVRNARPNRDGGSERSYQKRDQKPFEKRGEGGEGRPFRPKREDSDRPSRPRSADGERPYKPRTEGDKPFRPKREEGDRPSRPRSADGERPYKPRTEGDKPFRPKREEGDRPSRPRSADGERPYKPRTEGDKPFRPKREDGDRPSRPRSADGDNPFKKYVPFEDRKDKSARPSSDGEKRPFSDRKRPDSKDGAGKFGTERKGKFGDRDREEVKDEKPKNPFEGEDFYEDERPFTRSRKWEEKAKEGPMTLNKYMAHSGISSRREAASIIKEGKVMVNGLVNNEPGYRVNESDVITYDGKTMKPQKNLVYILLNKPKGFITTTEDEKGRRTVMELVANAETDRIYPIGRLDRNTTGVLIMTNDGDLTQRLSHPSYNCKKIYQVTLSEPLTKRDFDKIAAGVTLEDGPAPVDALAYLEKKNEIGIEIHSGKNRIVRRIFESCGYVVEKLDRVVFAGLTKKNVSRGKWRFLTEKEVINLKHFKG